MSAGLMARGGVISKVSHNSAQHTKMSVYLFWLSQDEIAVLHAEVKEGDAASVQVLNACAEFYTAYRAGQSLFQEESP